MSGLALLGGTPVVSRRPCATWPLLSPGDAAEVAAMVARGELSYYGREGRAADLEDGFRDYIGVPYALAVSSGTAALHSAYFGLGLQPGDDVIVPTYTFLATVTPLLLVNARPVLVDADPLTGTIDPASIRRHLTPATRAIVVTHMWGVPCDMPSVMRIAAEHGLLVVEDCSHAHGAECDGQKVGSFGDAAAFSLQGKKLVAAGQGGILLTRHAEVYERASLLGHFKVRAAQDVTSAAYARYASTGFGLNYRIHPLAAALADRGLGRLESVIAQRAANFDALSARLAGVPGLTPPHHPAWASRPVYYSYKPLYAPGELDGLPVELYLAAMRAEGVEIERSETLPLHREPLFRDAEVPLRSHGLGGRAVADPEDFPGSEHYARHALVLPAYTAPEPDYLAGVARAAQKVADHRHALLGLCTR